ncbi:MAG: hypothetical protein K8S14_08475, partial [Actinomycetia bacterium]|nr:hypothetical protein [Actinomycetes bacterium]
MEDTSNRRFGLAVCRLIAISLAVCLVTNESLAGIIMAEAEGSWGTVKVERNGSDQDFVDGMGLEDGDIIKTDRKSGAIIKWLDSNGEVFGEERFFGLPGPDGCADADGDRGKSKAEIKGKNKPGNLRETITKIEKGTSLFKTEPGKELQAKNHFIINKKTVVKKKGTEYALTYDLVSGQSSISTLDGAVDFDNIEW